MVIATEFMRACCTDDESVFPYNAFDTFSDSLIPILWVSRPTHSDNQRNFAAALRSLTEPSEITEPSGILDKPSGIPDKSRLLRALIGSPLFNDGLPWLDDHQAIMDIKSALQTEAFVDSGSVAQSRKLEDILNWLELKDRALAPKSLVSNGPTDAGPSKIRMNGLNM